jgi:hypothetical protein
VHAENGSDRGHRALWKALSIQEGEFMFFYGKPGAKTSIRENPMMLLMEACKRQDESAAGLSRKEEEPQT